MIKDYCGPNNSNTQNKKYHSFNDNFNYPINFKEKIDQQQEMNLKLSNCKTPKKLVILDQNFEKSSQFMNNKFKIGLLSPENKISHGLENNINYNLNEEKVFFDNVSSSKTNYFVNENKEIIGNNNFIKPYKEYSNCKQNSIQEEISNKFSILNSEITDIKKGLNQKIDNLLNKNNLLSFLGCPSQSEKVIGNEINLNFKTNLLNNSEENSLQYKFFKPESANINRRILHTNKNNSLITESLKYLNNEENNKNNNKLTYKSKLSYLKFNKSATSSTSPIADRNRFNSHLISNSNIEGENSNFINITNDNNNNNSFLSNSKIFEKNDDTNNSILYSRNKNGLKFSNELQICRSYDFEKNKYKKRDINESSIINDKDISNVNISYLDNTNKKEKINTANTKLKLINSKILTNMSYNFNKLEISKFNKINRNIEKTNIDKEDNKMFKSSIEPDKYEIKIIRDSNIKSLNEDYNNQYSQFQDLSTTVFDKSDQEIKKNFDNLKTKDSNCDYNSKEVFILRNSIKDLKSNKIDPKTGNKFLNIELFANHKKNVIKSNESTLNQEIKKNNNDGLSTSILKSISIVSQNKNLLENSFESSNNLSYNCNITNKIDNQINNIVNEKTPVLDNIKSIEDAHFNYIFITKASKKLTKNEHLNIDVPINLLNNVVILNEIEID